MAATIAGPTVHDMVSDYFSGVTLKAMLVGSGFTFDKDVHNFRDDVTSEVSGTGYTAGGITLSGVTIAQEAANDRVKLDANDPDFGTLTVSGIAGIVFYISTGSAATDRIVSVHTFPAVSPSGVNFTYQLHANGLGYFTY